jgi:short-subunit dehydrogenase
MAQKKIIIVGATSGIGKALACKYADEHEKVAITGRRNELLNDLKRQYPNQIISSCFDVRSAESREMIRQLIMELGGLDLLIYNAGYGAVSEQLSWENDKEITDINVNGFIAIVNYAFQFFIQQGYGQIAITSSIAAIRGNGMAPAYSASKAFMSVYSEGLNIKSKNLKKDITITDIRPGFMDTKPSEGYKRFWVVPVEKAAEQILSAISRKKRVAYVSKRWWFVAQLMKFTPFGIYRKIVS